MADKEFSMQRAAKINAYGKYSNIIIQLVVNAILSRILSPEDYGVVAIVTVFSTFFLTISDMGFSTAIVQCKDLEQKDIDHIFSFTIFIGVMLSLLFTVLSYGISIFYKNNVYFGLGLILNISLFLNTINMVPNGIMNREKRFTSIAVRTVTAGVVSAIIAIILAYLGFKYYSIVVQTTLTSIIIFTWNFFQTQPKLQFGGCINSVKKVISYSGFQFAFNIVNYFSRNLDNLLTGRFFGSADLGYYNKAYTLMLYPVNNLAGVITPVIHPLLSDFQHETNVIYKKYIKLLKFLFIIAGFVAPFCYLNASELINILFGTNWSSSVKCFEFLSLAILPQFIGSATGAIYQSLGKTKLLFYNAVLNTSITILAILIGIFIGGNITYLSLCVASAYIIHLFSTHFILIQVGFGYKFYTFIKDIRLELMISVAEYIATLFFPLNISNIFLSFFVKGMYLGIIYLFLLIITKEYKLLLSVISKR